MPTAEQLARANIDALLTAAGWALQDVSAAHIHAGRGVAISEFPLESGDSSADHPQYIGGRTADVIEAESVRSAISNPGSFSGVS